MVVLVVVVVVVVAVVVRLFMGSCRASTGM